MGQHEKPEAPRGRVRAKVRLLFKHILPEFPELECYVEPFYGGAALFFMKVQSHVEVINDFDGETVNLYRVVANHLEELVRQFR